MTLPRSVADVIAHHVTWELESIDRMYCNVYVPQLQREGGVVAFFRQHRGYPFASSALMDPISKTFVTAVHHFVQTAGVPLITFSRDRRKEDVAAAYRADFPHEEGVVLVGRAQEKRRSSAQRSGAIPTWEDLPVARALDRDGQPLLLLLHRSRLRPGLAHVLPRAPTAPTAPLRRAFDAVERAMDQWCADAKLAA